MENIKVVENTYCRVFGSIRQTQEKKHIMAFKVTPITNVNEITAHLLETKHVKLKLRQIRAKMVFLSECIIIKLSFTLR